ncbi:MAG: N-acetyltransferase [Pirellulaceae bacterium]
MTDPIPIEIREETPADLGAIRHVNLHAFELPGEADLVDALRSGGYVRLSLVAQLASAKPSEARIVGHILLSDLAIETETGDLPALALAPVAVLPEYQRKGIGHRLVEEALRLAREQGHHIMIVLGHPEYYPRFGFSAELAKPLKSPFSGPPWMALELTPGALEGVQGEVKYPAPFGV